VFSAIAIACVLMIPAKSIDDRQARGGKEDESKNPPDAMSVLLKHKPLLVLALALAIFHLGNAAIVPLYSLAAVSESQANGPSFVATTVVIAQGVMVVTSLVGMQVAGKRNYWPVILASFMFLPIRGVLAFFVTGWWGVVPMQVLDGIGTGLQTVAVPGMVARSLDGTGRINLVRAPSSRCRASARASAPPSAAGSCNGSAMARPSCCSAASASRRSRCGWRLVRR